MNVVGSAAGGRSFQFAPGVLSVARNALAQAGSQILLTPINLGFVMLVARTLGPDGYGAFQLSQSFPALIGAAIPLGMNVYFSRDLAQKPGDARRYAEHGYGIVLVTGALAYVIIQLAALGMGFSDEIRTLIIFSGVVAVASAVATLTGSFLRAFERLQLDALLSAGERLGGIVVGLLTLVVWRSPLALVAALLIAAIARLAVSQVLIRRVIGPFGVRLVPSHSARFVRTGWPFLLAGYCTIFNDNIGLTVLGSVGTTTEVGTYAAAWRLVVFGTIVALAFSNATLPMLARAAIAPRERLQWILDTVLPGLACATAAGAAFLALFAAPLVALIYGERFGDVPEVLSTLLLALPALSVMYFSGNALMSVGEQPFITRLQIVVAVLGLGLNVALAKTFGPLGTAIAVLLVDHALAIGYVWRLRTMRGATRVRAVMLAWLGGLLPGVVALHLPLPLVGQLAIALGLFGLSLFAARKHIGEYVRSARARLAAA